MPGLSLYHSASRQIDELASWFGAPLTTVARTIVDIARNSGTDSGLVVADAALHDGLVAADELIRAVSRASRRTGNKNARRVVELAHAKVESPLESLSRLLIADSELPMPEPQVWVTTDGGRYRVDGLWADRMVVLECDGMLKYGRKRGSLRAEKLRQEYLERAGYRVVRVTWSDVRNQPRKTLWRLSDALRCGGRV